MVLHSELHVNWVADLIEHLDTHGAVAIEATADAVTAWGRECTERAASTMPVASNTRAL